jgi:predicted O-methyltransferase YrrM
MKYEHPLQMLRYTEDADDGIDTDKTHFLMLYAMTMLIRPEVAVEIGSRRGGSAIWITRAMEEMQRGRLFCIDPFIACHGGAPAFEYHFNRNLTDLGLRERVTLLKMRSDDPEASPALLPPIDLLFIDGDHSYEGAKHDIARYVPHVRTGGAVIIHDCLSEPGVRRAIAEATTVLAPFTHCLTENRQGIWIGVKGA